MILLLLCALAAVAVLAAVASHYVHRYGWGPLAWRWCSGAALDGQYRTDATWTQRGTRVLHHSGHAIWWHWMPRLHRAGIRAAAEAVILAVVYGLAVARTVTLAGLTAAAATGILLLSWHAAYRVRYWKHERHYVRPLERTVTAAIHAAPVSLEVERDHHEIKAVTIEWPAQTEIEPGDQARVLEAVTARLAIEAPDPEWRLKGRDRSVTFTPSQPPPSRVTWEDLAADIASAKPHELLSGIGRRSAVVKASLENDSPHFGIIAGTGGGKSTLAAFWLLQELRRGAIALILDAKRFSHPWTFKDMDAEYGLLPNVGYCRTISDLHDGMCWLGDELDRRNAVAERSINARGDVLGDVGPRLFVVAEEMNLAHPALRQHWAEIRGPDDVKRSPAFTGLGGVSFAGRAVRMHLVPIGQMLKAEVLGGGDVRENIGYRAMTRYTGNSWKMQAGDLPMPPPPTVPGRWQCISGGTVTETQVPLIDMEQARDLAVGGVVTPCPAGMPGRSGALSVAALPSSYGPSDLPVVVGRAEEVAVGLTIAEAVADGIFGPLSLDAARRRVHRASLASTGRRGDGSYTYTRADLFTAARDARRKEPAA